MFPSLPEFRAGGECEGVFPGADGSQDSTAGEPCKDPSPVEGGQCGTLGSRGRHHTGSGQPGNWTLLPANPETLKSENSRAGGCQASRKWPPQGPEKSPLRNSSMCSRSLVPAWFASGESLLLSGRQYYLLSVQSTIYKGQCGSQGAVGGNHDTRSAGAEPRLVPPGVVITGPFPGWL